MIIQPGVHSVAAMGAQRPPGQHVARQIWGNMTNAARFPVFGPAMRPQAAAHYKIIPPRDDMTRVFQPAPDVISGLFQRTRVMLPSLSPWIFTAM